MKFGGKNFYYRWLRPHLTLKRLYQQSQTILSSPSKSSWLRPPEREQGCAWLEPTIQSRTHSRWMHTYTFSFWALYQHSHHSRKFAGIWFHLNCHARMLILCNAFHYVHEIPLETRRSIRDIIGVETRKRSITLSTASRKWTRVMQPILTASG